MQAAQRGDKSAYSSLLREILPVLRAIVGRRWGSRQDVDDIVQDILLSLHAVRNSYDPARPFMPWLVTIARRRVADAARRSSSRSMTEALVGEVAETFFAEDTNVPSNGYGDAEALARAMSGLPQGQRQAIELMKLREMSLKEAAAATGTSVGALKVSAHRGMLALRKALAAKS
ncbi:MAG: RNA polymerase sigma factor [Hyphomicrobiaceae bacterium]|nr:MAG: RNA polymerase sigma factor [Hyphomicrobiaceae bacterium]